MSAELIIWIPLLPLIGAFINGLVGNRLPRWLVGFIACSSIGASFVLSAVVFKLIGHGPSDFTKANLISNWIFAEDLSIPISFLLDRLSAVMILVVSGVSFLIHVYSIGYMSHEKGYARYFAYLNLFCFSMLLLVLADNILLMFVGWEGVGLCSYLLIGFWFEDNEKASAGKKAFIVNRIGDFGFILGIIFIFYFFGTLDFKELVPAVSEFSRLNPQAIEAVATLVALLLFVGAIGKSAQIPLYVWLPDAMAGPTPVSALIHAATMVTAGVYMIGRMHFIYDLSIAARTVVLVIGTVTALYAATIALVQNDIKKVLAYSTISQLGYMFMAMGLQAYSVGIFHLSTHAFFKALLFLGAGSVIHTLSGEQNIQKMGGLKNYLVLTTITFAIATGAIAGFPFFSGWFSKDEILLAAVLSKNPFGIAAWILGLLTAALTAFYMIRLFVLVFMGTTKVKKEDLSKLHESPFSMTAPMFILALLSLFGGFIGIGAYLKGYFPKISVAEHGFISNHFYHGLLVSLVSLGAIIGTAYLYIKRSDITDGIQKRFGWIYGVLSRKYMVDELYDLVFVKPFVTVSKLAAWIDKWIVDGAVNLSAYLVKGVSYMTSRFQTGLVQIYAFFLIAGLIAILGYLFWIG